VTPEGRVKAKVKTVLKRFGAYYHMVVQNGMGAPSLDFVGCHSGRFFAVETKAGNKDMTDRQKQTASTMREAGAQVFLVNEVFGLVELEQWLQEIENA
jgi:hypothetical protein